MKRKLEILSLVPILWIFFSTHALSFHDPKLWKAIFVTAGYSALILLSICLTLRPLGCSKRYQREIGLAAFAYACLHLSSYLVYKWLKKGEIPWKAFLDPILLAGSLAFLILFAMAITSNQISVKKLGWQRWKNLHRLVYLAEAAIFMHMLLQGGEVLMWALVIFIPLVALQLRALVLQK
jgi:sulfoxide reductase heme-binding subunit YedZ